MTSSLARYGADHRYRHHHAPNLHPLSSSLPEHKVQPLGNAERASSAVFLSVTVKRLTGERIVVVALVLRAHFLTSKACQTEVLSAHLTKAVCQDKRKPAARWYQHLVADLSERYSIPRQ